MTKKYPPGKCLKSLHYLFRDGNPNFAHLVAGLKPRDDLFPNSVNGIDRDAVGVEKTQDVLLQVQEDLIRILGRIDLVGDEVELFLKSELKLELVFAGYG